MNLVRVLHLVVRAVLTYQICFGLLLHEGELPLIYTLTIIFWLGLLVMQCLRPARWSFGIGIFLLCIVPIQLGLWQLAVHSAQGKALGVNDSWLHFFVSVLPYLIGGAAGIATRVLSRRVASSTRPS